MKIGLKAVSAYIPGETLDNIERASQLESSEDFIRSKIGMLNLARMQDDDDSSDLAAYAANKLFDEHGLKPEQVECLVFVTQNPDNHGLPHSSAILHEKLGLPGACATFDISLGCSGFVHGLIVVKSFMESQGFRNGLLVTADPYSKIIDDEDRDTVLLFGDGASASWLSDDAEWFVGASDFGTVSKYANALAVNENGILSMNGRAVFNFAAGEVPKSIGKVLEKAGLEKDDIDVFFLHQGSKFIVDTLAKRLSIQGKAPFLAENYGNTVSSSIPMLLADYDLKNANTVILSGFGVGLAWATCILEKK